MRAVIAIAVSIAAFGFALGASTARAYDYAFDAADDPAYAGGWLPGSNGGEGWNAGWVFYQTGSPADSAFTVETSTQNGSGDPDGDGDVDTSGVAWKIAARGGVSAGAERRFATPLKIGHVLSMDLDVADLPLGVYAIIEFIPDVGTIPRLSFGLRNGATNYRFYDASGDVDSGVPIDENGVHIEFSVTSANTYSMRVVPLIGDEVTHHGVLYGAGSITKLGVYMTADASGTMRRAFFNSPVVVPEPAAFGAGLGAVAMLAALRLRRSRA